MFKTSMEQTLEVEVAAPPSRDFDGFFREHRGPLSRALWLVTRDRYEADEIAQEAFLKLWERWDRVGSLEDPAGYLYRTAMNLYRNRRRRALLALRKVVHLIPGDDAFQAVEERDRVVRALGELTRRQRAAVVLIDLVGMSSEEAGDLLHVRPSTVRVLAARARSTLHELLGGDDA